MRLWSRPLWELDRQGFLGQWREALICQSALKARMDNRKFGWSRHPQITRILEAKDPLLTMGSYLYRLYLESKNRNFTFDYSRIDKPTEDTHLLPVSSSQLIYELFILMGRMKKRSPMQFDTVASRLESTPQDIVSCCPTFYPVDDNQLGYWEVTIADPIDFKLIDLDHLKIPKFEIQSRFGPDFATYTVIGKSGGN